MSKHSQINLLTMISIVSFVALVSFTGIGAANNITSYEIFKSHWRTLADWQFPKDAFNEGGEEEILWANIYQIGLSVVALCLAVYIDAKPTFIAAMCFFVIFGICHIIAHATSHPWTYLPLHYSFVATGLFIGMAFGGIKSYKTILCCLAVDFFLIQGLGQFFGVLSAFSIMCFGLRHHLALMFTVAIGCGMIWFGLLFNDVLFHGAHGLTEICACIGLTFSGIALVLHPNARNCKAKDL
jgi:hypothetical protein